jgi:biotin carboxyl carrier protein
MPDKKYKYVLKQGKLKKVDASMQVDYVIPSTSDFFSPVTNLIPNLGSVSGARVLIGDKSSLQAMTLANREAPLVQAAESRKAESFVADFGKRIVSLRAPIAGKITYVGEDQVKIKPAAGGKEISVELYNNYLMGRESYLHHSPKVKVGDSVEAGELLATSNYSDDKGNLALGMNLKTAVMPYRSYNFEDALVISQSAADKLVGEQLVPVRLNISRGIETDKDRYVSLFPNKYFNTQLNKLDASGVIKKGQKVSTGDPLILAFQPKSLKSLEVQLGKLSRALKHAYTDISETWAYEHEGEIVDAVHTGKLITVTIKTQRPMAQGDKLSNPFGAKGVVRIVSDSEMPQGEDGKPVDVLLNSMSVTSRVAPGLITTMAMGKLAQTKNKPIKITPFVEGSSVEQTIELLKKNNIKDVETLYDPVAGKKLEVFTGPSYYTRLHHIAEDKISTRSAGTSYDINMQPSKAGSHEKSKRLGNLATTAALSNDAKAVLRDVAVVRSTKNDDFWTSLKLGYAPPPPKVPFIFNKFISHLEGAGVKVVQEGKRFNIFPQIDKHIEEQSNGKVAEPLTYKLKNSELVHEDGGLFDPVLTGIYGDKYNHIDLNAKVPNPISEEPLRKLLGVTKAKYVELIRTGEIEKKLAAIDVNKKIADLKAFVKSERKTGRDEALKVLSFLTMLKEHGMTPSNLLLSKVPVIPAQYRPIVAQGDQIMGADVNELYKDLMLVNKSLENKDVPDELLHEAKKKVYDGVKAVYGLGEPISVRSQEKKFKGLLATALGTQGGSAKESMFQAKVVNKPIDLVGRGVLVPDANLELNEASIPQAILWNVYSPFVIRRLVRQGVPATKASDYVKNKHPLAAQLLQEELQDRPGIVTRDPQLSKYNFQGFYLKANPDPKDFSIKLNPLVFKGYGADSDGDQLNVQIPASEDAKEEIKEKLLPEKNLIYHRTFSPIYTPSNEAAVGLFAASYEDNKNKPVKYASAKEVLRDFFAGKLDIGDRVEVS